MSRYLALSYVSTPVMLMAADAGNDAAAAPSTDAALTEGNDTDSAIVPDDNVLIYIKDKEVISNIHKALDGVRTTYPTQEDAIAKLATAIEKCPDVGKLHFIQWDEDVAGATPHPDSIWVISTISERAKPDASKGEKQGINMLKALTLFPIPSTTAFINEQPEFVAKQVLKEVADIAFNGVRNSDKVDVLQAAINAISLNTENFVRQSGGMDTEAFDEFWTPFKQGFVEARPAYKEALSVQKPIVMKAIRSKAYALANPQTRGLEEVINPKTGESAWVSIFKLFLKNAATIKNPKTGEPMNWDLSPYQEWLDGRETFKLTFSDPAANADTSKLVVDFG